ncbi:MAG: site-2 protease family protein [Candidatus Levybacteria bacterium]|nr:site-2 protease family protein [Candidatus Levybacteria bacterium]
MELLLPIISITILLYSSILHEIMHGYVAYRLGDPTAKILGRITFNPVPHIDPFMSILIPLITYIGSAGSFIFGGAKPVPVDPFNLRDGMKDLALVSLAGPMTNIVLAIVAAVATHALFPDMSFNAIASSGLLGFILTTIINWNLLLAILNLLPIPPLDGSKLFALLLPERVAASYLAIGNSGLGMFILIALFFFPIGGFSLSGILGTLIVFSRSFLGF